MGEKEKKAIKEKEVKYKNSNPGINESIRELFGGIDPYNAKKITVYESKTQPNNQGGNKKTKNDSSKGKNRNKFLKGIIVGGVAGAIGTGVVAASIEGGKPASLEATLEVEPASSLGIAEDIPERLDQLQKMVDGSTDKIEVAGKIIELKKDIIKSKLVYAFDILGNPIDTSDIALIPEQVGENSVQIAIDGIGIYEYKEKEDGEEQKNTISYDIAHYVTDIVEMQGYESDLKQGVERSDFEEKAKESLDKTDKFAAGKMEIDKDGNITIKMRTKAELIRDRMTNAGKMSQEENAEYDR